MATRKNTSSATEGASSLKNIATRLNGYAALLNGVGQICEAEDIGGDALSVAATVCADINRNLCEMANRLDALAAEPGAA
jgi:hypothetical protein